MRLRCLQTPRTQCEYRTNTTSESDMSPISKIALGALATFLLGGTAMAADLMQPPPPDAVMTSNWEGGYVGLSGTYWSPAPNYGEITGVFGVNFTPAESFLIGIEGTVGYYSELGGAGYTGFDASVAVRAGVVAGPALIYASAGEWYDITGAYLEPFVGGGVEFAIGDSASIRLQGQYFPQDGSNNVSAGVLWHFH